MTYYTVFLSQNGEAKPSILAQTPYTNCQELWWRGDVGLFYSHSTIALCSRWVDQELLSIPKYSRVKCEAICLTAEAWMRLGCAAGQW